MDAVRRLALAALVEVLPVGIVEAALTSCGRTGQRVRTLPPWVTTYHVLVAAMDPSAGYDDVTTLLWSTLPAATGRRLAKEAPSRGAVTRARARLGIDPLEILLAELLAAITAVGPTTEVYLQKLRVAATDLWWICDAGTGALRGCVLDSAAVPGLLESAGVTGVVQCPPHDEPSQDLLERLGATAAVTVGEMPARFANPWARLRGRSPDALRQEILARACVQIAQELALHQCRGAT
jgi:hypothetical protein